MRTSFWTPLALAASLVMLAGTAQADPRWHGDIHRFEYRDMHHWRGGLWRHDYHDGHMGWWWVVGGAWYFYPQPVYPYPDPYTPPVIVQPQPVIVAPQTAAPAPQQYWYYCEASRGYYPYVPSCPAGWKPVPAAPSNGAPQ
jgi:hypothetical protein